MSTLPPTARDFEQSLEAERLRWLRQRMVWYCAVVCALALGSLLMLGVTTQRYSGAPYVLPLEVTHTGVQLLLCAVVLLRVWRKRLDRRRLLATVYWLIVIFAAMEMAFSRGALEMELRWERQRLAQTPSTRPARTAVAETGPDVREVLLNSPMRRVVGAGTLLGAHLLACAFLPLTAREALRPVPPVLLLNLAVTLPLTSLSVPAAVGSALLAPLACLPGVLICWYRMRQFRREHLLALASGQYEQLRQELVNARRIHESLFPAPVTEGPIRLVWLYRPTRELGGDYLHVHRGDDGALNVTLIDVTGHGVVAALTVNRFHGELERLFAEHPGIAPGEVLDKLNRYVHLTLVKHGIYATALCLRLEARSVSWANAGQPSPMLYGPAREMQLLEVTAPLLGAVDPANFDADMRQTPWNPGDQLLAVTDGLTEARDEADRTLGLEPLVHRVQAAQAEGLPPERVLEAVMQTAVEYRAGPSQDDMLLIHAMHAGV